MISVFNSISEEWTGKLWFLQMFYANVLKCDGEETWGYWQQKYIMQLCTCLGVLFLILVDPFHILWRQSNLIFFSNSGKFLAPSFWMRWKYYFWSNNAEYILLGAFGKIWCWKQISKVFCLQTTRSGINQQQKTRKPGSCERRGRWK